MNSFFTSIAAFAALLFFSNGFAQSKKELKAELEHIKTKMARDKMIADSTLSEKEKIIADLQHQKKIINDSLSIKTKQYEMKQQELESYLSNTSRMGGRIRMKEPDLSKIKSDIPSTVTLKLLVDENGSIIEAVNDPKRSTTTDQAILEEVINLVKKELRYSREPGASLLQSNFSVKIGPKN